jgi:hypothetical protein
MCTRPIENTHYTLQIFVDYSKGIAASTNINENYPIADHQARIFQPATVTPSTVNWTLWGTSPNGLVGDHYTLNRTTGELHVYDDLVSHGDDYHCDVNAVRPFPSSGPAG